MNKTRPFSVSPEYKRIKFSVNIDNVKTRNIKSRDFKNKMAKSSISNLDTYENEVSHKYFHFLDMSHSATKTNNTNKFAKSQIFLNMNKKQNIFNFDKNMIIEREKPKNRTKIKYKLKEKHEFRPDQFNFNKNYIQKKIFLDKYCGKEIKFHKKLLKSKSVECEVTKEPCEFDCKKTKRDAELTFNTMLEIAKSALNKKNFTNFFEEQKNLSENDITNNLLFKEKKKKKHFDIKHNNGKEGKSFCENKSQVLKKNEEYLKILDVGYDKIIKKEKLIHQYKSNILRQVL